MALGDMPVQQMADQLGMSLGQVSRWLNGKGAPPRRAYVLQWALITDTDVEWLASGKVPAQGGNDSGGGGRPQQDSNLQPSGWPAYLGCAA